MTYRGRVENGVVVFDGTAPLREGTIVEVQPAAHNDDSQRGTATAILRHAGIWADQADEVDQLLPELRDEKQAELRAQRDQDASL
jgi:hypothetical protein